MRKGLLVTQEWNALWRRYADSAERNPAQAFRREQILRALSAADDGSRQRLLDIGCGQGDFCREAAGFFPHWEIRGIDISASGLAFAKSKCPQGQFYQADLMDPGALPPWREWASCVVCSELLEHVEDPATVVANIHTLMQPGGRLVVTVPSGPRTQFDLHIGHLRHFTAGALRVLLATQGLEPVIVLKLGFPFFNLYRLVVLASGRRVISEAARGGQSMSLLARTSMAVFRFLFRWNARSWGPGWQLLAIARRTGSGENLKTGPAE